MDRARLGYSLKLRVEEKVKPFNEESEPNAGGDAVCEDEENDFQKHLEAGVLDVEEWKIKQKAAFREQVKPCILYYTFMLYSFSSSNS
jgi:hypothetical protein